MEAGTSTGFTGAQGCEPNQPHGGRPNLHGQLQHQDLSGDGISPRQGASSDAIQSIGRISDLIDNLRYVVD
eukprot:5742768-Prorocentrum_lima.AAC.1